MFYKIIEISKDTSMQGVDCVYVVVNFYSTQADVNSNTILLTEDFQMPHLKLSDNVPDLDVNGNFVLNDNRVISPHNMQPNDFPNIKRKIVSLDISKEIRENIERHISHIQQRGLSGNRTIKNMDVGRKQASGLSQRQEVLTLLQSVKEV